MNWIQVLTIVFANVGLCLTLFLWLRKEANADRKEFTAGMNDFKKEVSSEMKDFKKMWAQETKDFHARLCLAEERSKK